MPPKLLLIEDQDALRENVAELLGQMGYVVTTASDGQQGLTQAVRDPPDLIICDILMPELDGYQVLEIVRATPVLVRTPFIFLTAKGSRTEQRHGMNSGADDYLAKPFQISDLTAAIESRLKHKRQWLAQEQPPADYLETIEGYNGRGRMLLRTEECSCFFIQERGYYVLHPLGTFQIDASMEELTNQLNPVQFFRVNRREIVHRTVIRRYSYWQNGKYCLFLSIGEQAREVILPRARYRAFLRWLQSSANLG